VINLQRGGGIAPPSFPSKFLKHLPLKVAFRDPTRAEVKFPRNAQREKLMAKRTKRPRLGRPTRMDASRRALAGIDLSTVDPIAVLRAIAADVSAPASARVAAAKALAKAITQDRKPPAEQPEGDSISRRALKILDGGKK
jgi:hypothetical protein